MTEFNIGDLVVASRDIYQEADDYFPRMMYARKGDILVIRQLRNSQVFPYNVSHQDVLNNSFCVSSFEIENFKDE